MATVIRSRKATLYFQRGGWVLERAEAQEFADPENAMAACRKWRLIDVEITSSGKADPVGGLGLPFIGVTVSQP